MAGCQILTHTVIQLGDGDGLGLHDGVEQTLGWALELNTWF